MEKIVINKLGPITHCDLEINHFMVFTGPQASGKSTIAKSIFFFKNIKNVMLMQINKRFFNESDTMKLSTKNRLIKEIRSNFLQTFGTTWCMDNDMFMEYYYTDTIYIKIRLKNDPISPNYIWIEFSEKLIDFLDEYDNVQFDVLTHAHNNGTIKKNIDEFFDNSEEIIYIPAGRSMMTLFSSQLMFMYSVMSDDQKRSLDYCTQNYLERIMQLKPSFSNSIQTLIKDKIELTDIKINKECLQQCADLMKQILHGEYRNIDGEERLQVAEERYVKINFASSGQQEAVWILNVVFYYLLNKKKSYFIVEEPESHLFPNAQKLITEFVSLAKNDGNKILLTTHSPYILGTVNNMLYANKISKEVDNSKLGRIITPLKWIDSKRMSAYYVESGYIQSCMDEEFEAIDNEIIDGASDEINTDYEKMVNLLHDSGMEVR
ncbi:MAG: AAA family ATPase [Anaerostipes sp.]|nr:AAA family ATPase [Anaerostipes sp.]